MANIQEDEGRCSCCQVEFKPGEQFTVINQRRDDGKRVNVECIKNDPDEISFKVIDKDHQDFGQVFSIKRPIRYVN